MILKSKLKSKHARLETDIFLNEFVCGSRAPTVKREGPISMNSEAAVLGHLLKIVTCRSFLEMHPLLMFVRKGNEQ